MESESVSEEDAEEEKEEDEEIAEDAVDPDLGLGTPPAARLEAEAGEVGGVHEENVADIKKWSLSTVICSSPSPQSCAKMARTDASWLPGSLSMIASTDHPCLPGAG